MYKVNNLQEFIYEFVRSFSVKHFFSILGSRIDTHNYFDVTNYVNLKDICCLMRVNAKYYLWERLIKWTNTN